MQFAAPHVGRVLACVVALLAWRIARRRPQHHPLAVYLAAVAVADILRWAAAATYGDPAYRYGLGLLFQAPGPYTGATRAAFHASQALLLVGPLGLAMAAVRTLAGRRVDHLAGASVLLWVALVATYPATRGALLTDRIYPAVEWAALAVIAWATVVWARAPRWPGFPEVLTWLYGATALSALLVGPYSTGSAIASWWTGWGSLLTCQLASVAIHAAWFRAVRSN